MNIKNRTFEFQQSVATYRKINRQVQQNDKGADKRNVSEFQKRASSIAREISSSAQLLSKLALLAKRKPMLNDNPVEIAELSFLIKRKIYAIEQSLVDLSKLQRQQKGGAVDATPEVATQHSKNVVNLLNTKMRNISGGFKDVLEERQRMEMANRDRWEKISSNTGRSGSNGATAKNPNANDTVDANANLLATETTYNNSNPFMSSSVVEEEINSHATKGSELALPQSDSQMLLMMEEGQANNVYLQERNNAVEMIDSTIQEVGNLFQQLASMVQEQGEVIQRIDANVDEVDLNITGAQRELLKYFDRVKSNRWLVAKVFFIIFCFFLVWVLVN